MNEKTNRVFFFRPGTARSVLGIASFAAGRNLLLMFFRYWQFYCKKKIRIPLDQFLRMVFSHARKDKPKNSSTILEKSVAIVSRRIASLNARAIPVAIHCWALLLLNASRTQSMQLRRTSMITMPSVSLPIWVPCCWMMLKKEPNARKTTAAQCEFDHLRFSLTSNAYHFRFSFCFCSARNSCLNAVNAKSQSELAGVKSSIRSQLGHCTGNNLIYDLVQRITICELKAEK